MLPTPTPARPPAEWTLAQCDTGGCAAQIADVDGDGCITVGDIQAVAGAYTASIQSLDGPVVPQATIAPDDFVPSATWTVNTVADDPDADIRNGVCATAAGQCSLRAAIQNANVHSGNDLITFNIAGTGVHAVS